MPEKASFIFFASFLPRDEAAIAPVLDIIESKGHRVIRHPDTTHFAKTPAYVHMDIAEANCFIAVISKAYLTSGGYLEEPAFANRTGKNVLAILLDNSPEATNLAQESDATLIYDYAKNPDSTKAAEAILSTLEGKSTSNGIPIEYLAFQEYLTGLRLYRKCDYERAVPAFQKAIKMGSKPAVFQLGVCYLNGHGIKQDIEQAYSCFDEAAEAGIADAMYQAALMLLEGKDVPKNEALAVSHLKKAADKNSPPAITLLAHLYYNGEASLAMDKEYALSLFDRAAASRYQPAIDFLEKLKKAEEA